MTDSQTKVSVAQIGARRHYAIPCAFQNANMLRMLYTDVCLSPGWANVVKRVIPKPVRPKQLQRLLSRTIPDIPPDKISTFPLLGYSRTIRDRSILSQKERIKHYIKYNSEFGRKVVNKGLNDTDSIYVFNGAGLEILQEAKKHNLKCILDQTSAACEIEQILLQKEQEEWSNWSTAHTTAEDWKPMADREREERALSDMIVCGSDYVADSIAQAKGPSEKCVVVPYGTRHEQFKPTHKSHGESLNVLYIGTLQLRKGIQYLLDAARIITNKEINIKAVGPIEVSDYAIQEIKKHITVEPPVARPEVQTLYDWADVVVLPSISEGSSNVCYEALACGIPVITTPNAGSIIRDGTDGWIVPIRSGEAIAEKIEILCSNRDLLKKMSENALTRSKEYTWNSYGAKLASHIASL